MFGLLKYTLILSLNNILPPINNVYHSSIYVPIAGKQNILSKIATNWSYQMLKWKRKQSDIEDDITDGMIGFLRIILLGKFGEIYNIGNQSNEISMINLVKIFDRLLTSKAVR